MTDSDNADQQQEHQVEAEPTSSESSTSLSSPVDLQDVMESMARITLAGCGGSIVGLSLEKRLENMRVITAAGLSAAARRKRSPMTAVNLPISWGISCMVFCCVIEASRLTSPSTVVSRSLGLSSNTTKDNNRMEFDAAVMRKTPPNPIITISDYTIGGICAGIAVSFGSGGRQFNKLHQSIPRVPVHLRPGRFFGVGPGIALGFVAGCLQAATDYGLALAGHAQRRSSEHERGH